MPLVRVVLPEPRSPVSRTSTGAWSLLENSLPHCVVSSAECVMTSSLTGLQLLKKLMARVRDRGSNFCGEQARLVSILRGELGSFAVQVDTKSKHARPVFSLKLRGQRCKNPRQNVAGPALCESWIAGGIDENLPIGAGDDGVRTLQDDVSIPAARSLLRILDTIFLHTLGRGALEPCHLARVRRD